MFDNWGGGGDDDDGGEGGDSVAEKVGGGGTNVVVEQDVEKERMRRGDKFENEGVVTTDLPCCARW